MTRPALVRLLAPVLLAVLALELRAQVQPEPDPRFTYA
jgi:hypothetical protein